MGNHASEKVCHDEHLTEEAHVCVCLSSFYPPVGASPSPSHFTFTLPHRHLLVPPHIYITLHLSLSPSRPFPSHSLIPVIDPV